MGVTQKLSVLVFDLETAPGEAYMFSPKMRYIPHYMVKHLPFVTMWSAAWLHGGKVMSDCATPSEINMRDDSRVVQSMADLMREADIVLAHNGDNFDVPWIRGRCWINDLEPLGPIASIDTKKLSARDFAMPHNNLDALIQAKLGTSKIKTDFSWWKDIIELQDEAKEKALRRMLRYCKKDTKELRDLFKTMIPHVHRLPRLVDSTDAYICPTCGSDKIQKRGKKRTKAYTYQQFYCNHCRRYSSEKSNDRTNRTELRST